MRRQAKLPTAGCARRRCTINHSAAWGRPSLLNNPLVKIGLLLALASFFYIAGLLRIFTPSSDSTSDGTSIANQRSFGEQDSLATSSRIQQAHELWKQGNRHAYQLNCDIDNERLTSIQQRYGLEDRLRYLKRYVRFHRKPNMERLSMTHVPQRFLASEFRTIDMRKKYPPIPCDSPINVDVSPSEFPSTANASMFMFGISTTHARLTDEETTPLKEWKYWLTDSQGVSNGGKLLLMLLDANNEQLQEVANLLGDAGVDADVYHSKSSVEMAVRYLNLIPALYEHPQASIRKWFVLCDDDTFFPYMHALVDKFNEFDSSLPMYVGTLSEDVNALIRHGSQAFGGAGVFLSRPMAGTITELFDSCTTYDKIRDSDTGSGPRGDNLLRACIYENTDVRLKTLWDLWQLDITGDASGFYEWGGQPLSVHHYKGGEWTSARPLEFTKIAHACGEDCSLQRFKTEDDFVISGHSVAYYPEGVNFDWDMVERTMGTVPRDEGWNLDYKFGPQRPSLSRTGKKVAWDLLESQVNEDGSVLQTYTRRWDDWRWMYPDDSPISSLDGILELVWIPSQL